MGVGLDVYFSVYAVVDFLHVQLANFKLCTGGLYSLFLFFLVKSPGSWYIEGAGSQGYQ